MASEKFILPLFYKEINDTTSSWTDEEFGAYMRLLIHQWSQGEIPKEMKRLNRISESAERNWVLLGKKFLETDTGLKNLKMEEIRSEKEAFNIKQKDNSKKGGGNPNFKKGNPNPYYDKKSQSDNPKDNPKDNPPHYPKDKPSPSPSSLPLTTPKPLPDEITSCEILPTYPFEDFWNLYDKKVDRVKCEKKWLSLSEKEQDMAMRYIPFYRETQPDKQFRKDPSTFINNKSWNNELIIKNQSNGKPNNGPESAADLLKRTIELDLRG